MTSASEPLLPIRKEEDGDLYSGDVVLDTGSILVDSDENVYYSLYLMPSRQYCPLEGLRKKMVESI